MSHQPKQAKIWITLIYFSLLAILSGVFYYFFLRAPKGAPLKAHLNNWELVLKRKDVALNGESHFKLRCSTCHSMDGKGSPSAPDLTDNQWLYGSGQFEEIFTIVQNGSPSGRMFGWGKKLKTEDLEDIAVYVKTLSDPELRKRLDNNPLPK